MLDIGCSFGEFLAHFGPGSTGLTIEKEEATYGQAHNLDVQYGNIEEEHPLTKKYEVIFCNNLLEHLYSPHRFLTEVREHLQKDGLLILGVPCVPFPKQLMLLTKFRGSLASNHINFFISDTLALTVERAGWKIQTIRGFHFKNIFLDKIFHYFYPHLYVVAAPIETFEYSEKRKRELAGYAPTVKSS